MKFTDKDNNKSGEIKAIGARYLVRTDDMADRARGNTSSLIVIPETAKARAQLQSTVMELGTDNADTYEAKVGDRVLHSAHAGIPVEVPRGEYTLSTGEVITVDNVAQLWRTIDKKDILAVIRFSDIQ